MLRAFAIKGYGDTPTVLAVDAVADLLGVGAISAEGKGWLRAIPAYAINAACAVIAGLRGHFAKDLWDDVNSVLTQMQEQVREVWEAQSRAVLYFRRGLKWLFVVVVTLILSDACTEVRPR